MSTKHTTRIGIVLVALLLVTFAFAAAPKAPAGAPAAVKLVAAAQAYAEEAAPAEGAAAEGAAAEGEAAKGEAGGEKEIPHTVGNLTDQQKADLTSAWEGTPGFNILIVSILGLIVIVGIVGFGAVKQARI